MIGLHLLTRIFLTQFVSGEYPMYARETINPVSWKGANEGSDCPELCSNASMKDLQMGGKYIRWVIV